MTGEQLSFLPPLPPAPAAEWAAARSRRSDPRSSHDAAKWMNESGEGTRQDRLIVGVLRRVDRALTAHEIGRELDFTNVVVCRRMKTLVRRGIVRQVETGVPCPISGRRALRWQAVSR